MTEEGGVKEYPLYHCQECSYFFKKVNGKFVREGLKGQQSEVIDFVCPECRGKKT